MNADDDALLAAARRAAEVLEEFEAKKRIEAGYTRIDPEQIASASDVVVIFRKFDLLLGGFLVESGNPGIIVNWDRPRGLVHMTCAHELGHFSLGHESTSDTTVDVPKSAALVERTANQFAYALLAPAWLVAQTMRNHRWGRASLRNPAVVYQMSLRLGMSYTAMAWSLVRLGHLTPAEASELGEVPPIAIKRALLGGAAPDDSRKDVWMLTEADRDRVLEPGLGDQLVFDLPNHASSGHLWSVNEAVSEGFMLKPFVRDARHAPARKGADVVVGGDGARLRYELTRPQEAVVADQTPTDSSASAGDADAVPTLGARKKAIALSELAPWKREQAPIGHLSMFAEFERLDDGLPQPEIDRRLARMRPA